MKVQVTKAIELQEGEELSQFIGKLHDALATSGTKANKSLYITKIFDGFVIARDFELQKFYKYEWERDENGGVQLKNEQEVMQVFAPVSNKQEKAAEGQAQRFDITKGLVMLGDETITPAIAETAAAGAQAAIADQPETEIVDFDPPKAPGKWDQLFT
jgi:hypothetical protein